MEKMTEEDVAKRIKELLEINILENYTEDEEQITAYNHLVSALMYFENEGSLVFEAPNANIPYEVHSVKIHWKDDFLFDGIPSRDILYILKDIDARIYIEKNNEWDIVMFLYNEKT